MDISSPLKPDVFRVVTVILLPGLVASFPWLAWFFWPSLMSAKTWAGSPVVIGLFVTAIALVVGMVVEDIGSEIEVNIVDRDVCRAKSLTKADFDQQWMGYLFSSATDRFIAHRYLRAMVTRLKFELSMVPACISCAVATGIAFFQGVGFDWAKSLGLGIAAVSLAIYLLDQAKKGARQLHEIRLEISRRELSLPLSAKPAANAHSANSAHTSPTKIG